MSIDVVIRATVASESAVPALIARAQAGDSRAFELLLEPRLWRLNRVAMSITANEADARDAVQDGCIRAWKALPQLRDPARFDVWLWRIVVNSCRTVVTKRRQMTVREIAIVDDLVSESRGGSGPGPGESLPEVDLIRRAFGRLDVDKRTVLILHHVDERPIGEIARILHVPEGTAKWRLFKARQALERALELERR
jgi:RNA polymerase sigma factor (sigma-70 family)